jgi:hypothetical protein
VLLDFSQQSISGGAGDDATTTVAATAAAAAAAASAGQWPLSMRDSDLAKRTAKQEHTTALLKQQAVNSGMKGAELAEYMQQLELPTAAGGDQVSLVCFFSYVSFLFFVYWRLLYLPLSHIFLLPRLSLLLYQAAQTATDKIITGAGKARDSDAGRAALHANDYLTHGGAKLTDLAVVSGLLSELEVQIVKNSTANRDSMRGVAGDKFHTVEPALLAAEKEGLVLRLFRKKSSLTIDDSCTKYTSAIVDT